MKGRGSNAKSLATQRLVLLMRYPGSIAKIERSKLQWECRLRPQTITDTYLFQIEYKLRERPAVYISEGRLAGEKDLESIPHHFEVLGDGRVHACLDKFDWKGSMLLADSVVPWAMEWALYYEIWLATGEWCAAEAPHKMGAIKSFE